MQMNEEVSASAKNIGKEGTSRQTDPTQEIPHRIGITGSKEDDEESVLSSVEHQETDLKKLEISDYCVSSDAETEKMNDDKVQQGLEATRPHISDLINQSKISTETNDRKREIEQKESVEVDKEPRKKVKLEESTNEMHTGSNQKAQTDDADDGNEVGDEGEGEDEINDELKKEIPTKLTGHDELHEPTLNVEMPDKQTEEAEKAEEVEEVDEVEEPEEVAEEEEEEEEEEDASKRSNSKKEDTLTENDLSKPLPSMPSPIEIEQQRLDALKEITEIEYKFVELRQKLYDNKLLRLQTELQMCREGSHPELQTYYQKIASIRDYKLRRAYQRQKYELKCIDKETRATRTFIHQDFLRQASDLRNQFLNETTQKWYDINKERRDMDICVPEVNYHVPIKIAGKTLSCITGYAGSAQQRYPGEPLAEDLECENIKFRYRSNAVDKLEVIVDRMRLNNELSDLEGLKRYFHAFPGAPDLNGLRDSEVFDDLQRLPLQR